MQQSLWRSKHYILSRGNRKKRKIEIDISWSSTLLSFYWVFDNMISRKKKKKILSVSSLCCGRKIIDFGRREFRKVVLWFCKSFTNEQYHFHDCSSGFYVSFRICKWFSKLFFFSVNGSGLLILFWRFH